MRTDHGLRHVDSAINLAEMANGNTGHGVSNGEFHMDVDPASPQSQEFDRPQG